MGYREIAEDLAKRIERGEWAVHLPSVPELSAMYDVSYQTARRATKVLEDRGQVVVAHGKKTLIVSADQKTVAEAIVRVSAAMATLDGVRQYLVELSHELDAGTSLGR